MFRLTSEPVNVSLPHYIDLCSAFPENVDVTHTAHRLTPRDTHTVHRYTPQHAYRA